MSWQGHVSDRRRPARLHILEVVRGKETLTMFSVARQQLDTHPLLECLSLTRVVPRRAIPFPTARSRWFDSRLRVVLRALWAPWAAPHGGHAHRLVCICARACLWVTSSHLTTSPPPPPPPSGSFSLSKHPSCCYTLRISYHIPPHRAAAKKFPGRIICQPRFLILLPPTYTHAPSFTKLPAETGPTNVPFHSGQTPDVVVLARCHTDVRLPLTLTLSPTVPL